MSLQATAAVTRARLEYLDGADGRKVSPATAKYVLLTLADFADPAGRNAWPSIGTLAATTQLDRVTIIRTLDACLKAGLLAVQQRPGAGRRSVTYSLVLARLRSLHPAAADEGQDEAPDQPELSTEVASGNRLPRATRGPGQPHRLPQATSPVAQGNFTSCPGQPNPSLTTSEHANEPRPDLRLVVQGDTDLDTEPVIDPYHHDPETITTGLHGVALVKAQLAARAGSNEAPGGVR